jgi:phosphate transport system substrate-binding protein
MVHTELTTPTKNLKMSTKWPEKILISCLWGVSIIILAGCNNNTIKEPADTITSGEIWISADESLKPIVDSEVAAFMRTYSGTKIHVKYKPEADAIHDILVDSSRVVVAARQLTPDELQVFQKRGFTPELVNVAVDAIAIIVNRDNTDTLLTTKQISGILSGKIDSWKGIDKSSVLGDMQLIFDNKKSGVVRYLIDSVNNGKALPANSYALKNTPDVIDYVSKNKNAVGFIGVNWLSDKADSATSEFLKRIHIINVQPRDSDDFYPPNQYYIAYHGYPYLRNIYVIDPEARMGLGTGFANFFWGDVGQTIITRSGLLPAHASMRFNIELKKNFN